MLPDSSLNKETTNAAKKYFEMVTLYGFTGAISVSIPIFWDRELMWGSPRLP